MKALENQGKKLLQNLWMSEGWQHTSDSMQEMGHYGCGKIYSDIKWTSPSSFGF